MLYTIVDLLEKLIMIEQKGCSMYRSISNAQGQNAAIRATAGVLAKEEERHVDFYTVLKDKLTGQPDIAIDFDIYDKASQLVQDFNKRFIMPTAANALELLKYARDFEKRNVALLLNIQGRLVRLQDAVGTVNYKVLSEIIAEEQKHVANLEQFVKE